MDLLFNVSSMKKDSSESQYEPSLVRDAPGPRPSPILRSKYTGSSWEETLGTLRTEPDHDTLISVLSYVRGVRVKSSATAAPSPSEYAQFVQLLVLNIAPNYWPVLKAESSPRTLFMDCLRNLTGLNACLARLKALLQDERSKDGPSRPDHAFDVENLLDMISAILEGEDGLHRLWIGSSADVENEAKKRPLQQDFVNILGGGRVLALAAEAQEMLDKKAKDSDAAYWITSGKQYSTWLAKCLSYSALQPLPGAEPLLPQLLVKSFRLGHPEDVMQTMLSALILRSETGACRFHDLLIRLTQLERRKVVFALLSLLSHKYLRSSEPGEADTALSQAEVAAVAGLIHRLVDTEALVSEVLENWLVSSSGAVAAEGIGIRRAVMAVVAQHKTTLIGVLEKAMDQFSDPLYIKHTPVLHQEAQAQVLLLAAGYVHRLAPLKLVMLKRSTNYTRGISSRLAASRSRARLLGMVVGETLSSLTDSPETRLDFHMEDTSSEEAEWYRGLVSVSDTIGPIDSLMSVADAAKPTTRTKRPGRSPKAAPLGPARPTGFIVEEVDSSNEAEEDEDDEPIPYAKPDSDAEDSDDDPTMVRRDKPRAPVYVRELMAYLRDSESYDRQKLGLASAPTLLRRKAQHGTEVRDHLRELVPLLIGIQDKFDLEDFDQIRLQSLIALCVAQPDSVGPKFAQAFFEGDFSLSQRSAILTTMGLAARELAGFDQSAYASAAAFPSNALPERVQRLYLDASDQANKNDPQSRLQSLPQSALESITHGLTSDLLAPLAARAADSATGPDVLKLSSFTKRLQKASSGKGKGPNGAAGVRNIPNTTAQLIASAFFFPLTARFFHAVHASSARFRGILFQPFLLIVYIKTLALLLHAAGPSTLALPQMTSELWELLLGSAIQTQCVGDAGVTQAVLFALLTLLDVNENRMRELCQNQGKEVVQTQEWVARIFEETRGHDGGEEDEIKMLAAGILIRLRDGLEKYRLLLMGDLI